MIPEDNDTHYKLVAPDVDSLLGYFDRHGSLNPNSSTPALLAAFNSIFEILTPLAPLKKNNEAKAIWIRVPRGSIEKNSRRILVTLVVSKAAYICQNNRIMV